MWSNWNCELEFTGIWKKKRKNFRFGYSYLDEKYDEIIQEMIDLDPTNVELSFMVCQLCLHHIGKKFQGDILKVAERLQSSIANNLHDYYVNKEKRPRYSGRIAKMMKINNYIQVINTLGEYQKNWKKISEGNIRAASESRFDEGVWCFPRGIFWSRYVRGVLNLLY